MNKVLNCCQKSIRRDCSGSPHYTLMSYTGETLAKALRSSSCLPLTEIVCFDKGGKVGRKLRVLTSKIESLNFVCQSRGACFLRKFSLFLRQLRAIGKSFPCSLHLKFPTILVTNF